MVTTIKWPRNWSLKQLKKKKLKIEDIRTFLLEKYFYATFFVVYSTLMLLKFYHNDLNSLFFGGLSGRRVFGYLNARWERYRARYRILMCMSANEGRGVAHGTRTQVAGYRRRAYLRVATAHGHHPRARFPYPR